MAIKCTGIWWFEFKDSKSVRVTAFSSRTASLTSLRKAAKSMRKKDQTDLLSLKPKSCSVAY
jgi:hypothetical protein